MYTCTYLHGKKRRKKLGSINEPNDYRNRAVTMPISLRTQGSKFVVGVGVMPRWEGR